MKVVRCLHCDTIYKPGKRRMHFLEATNNCRVCLTSTALIPLGDEIIDAHKFVWWDVCMECATWACVCGGSVTCKKCESFRDLRYMEHALG